MDWREEVALTVATLFREANGQELPTTLEHWQEIGERYQRDLFIFDGGRRAGVMLDEIIVVRNDPDPAVVGRRCAHELAEYLLRSTWDAPYCFQSCNMDETEIHRIARMVEDRCA